MMALYSEFVGPYFHQVSGRHGVVTQLSSDYHPCYFIGLHSEAIDSWVHNYFPATADRFEGTS